MFETHKRRDSYYRHVHWYVQDPLIAFLANVVAGFEESGTDATDFRVFRRFRVAHVQYIYILLHRRAARGSMPENRNYMLHDRMVPIAVS
jgi:hypothetical protein